MSFRSFAVLGLTVVFGGACAGCHVEYQATLTCAGCNGSSSVVTGDWSCSPEGAAGSAADKCLMNDVPGSPTYEERLVFNLGGCPEDQVAPSLEETARVAIGQAGRAAGIRGVLPAVDDVEEVAAADGPACPPKTVDLKVTVFQDVPVPGCPGDVEVEVSYFKEVSDGVLEYVTLSAMVPVGGNHEFICLDAQVDLETGLVGTVRVAVLADLNCLGDPDLATASSYSQIPADGSSLECRANLDANRLDAEIIPPANPTATTADIAPDAVRRDLTPVPDPRFSAKR